MSIVATAKRVKCFTIAEYHLLTELGFFGEGKQKNRLAFGQPRIRRTLIETCLKSS